MENIREAVRSWFREDLGPAWRDVSVEAIGSARFLPGIGTVRAKSAGIACGLPFIEPIFRELEEIFRGQGLKIESTRIELSAHEGNSFAPGDVLAVISGPVKTLLSAERTMLNLVQRLSGIASLTRQFVEAIVHTKCCLLDTRKTTPGLRALEKYAVRVGRGVNHRFGLYDMIMLKDNHIAAMGGDIEQAVAEARRRLGPTLKIEVETASLTQVQQALDAGADIIMLDNMSLDMMREAVTMTAGRVPLEASGGVNLDTVRGIAETGVDFISVGALTHSAIAKDLSMKIQVADGPVTEHGSPT